MQLKEYLKFSGRALIGQNASLDILLLQDSPYRFHAIPKPALSMRIWWL